MAMMASFRRVRPLFLRRRLPSLPPPLCGPLLRSPSSPEDFPPGASPPSFQKSPIWTTTTTTTAAAAVRGAFAENRRGYAKAKKSKGDEDSDSVYEDVYPSVKENTVKQMEAALESLARELSKLRTGRVSSGTLDHVTVVDNNGIRSPLTHVAAVTVIDNEKLRVTPFDSAIVKCVERGIRSSPLKLNPSTEGDIITVPIPKPTKEYIETMIKVVGKAGETAKTSIRRVRQNAMDAIKKSTGHISKDDIKRREKEIEELTKKFVKLVDDSCKSKEREMLPG